MDFTISKEQQDLLEQIDQFCQENLSEDVVQQWLAESSVPDSFMQKYYRHDFGLAGLPKRMGGTEASMLTRVLILERLGMRTGATLPVQGQMLDTAIVSSIANEEQIERLVEMLKNEGRPGFSLAVTETLTGSSSLNAATTATETDDGFIINGAKSFVTSGQYAPYIVLFAHDEALESKDRKGRKPLSFFLVPRDAEGVDIIPIQKLGQHLIPAAEILFNNVHVGKDALIGQRGDAARVLLNFFEYGRTFVCASSVGLAQAAFNQAMAYAITRTVADHPITAYQQVQELIVDMQIKIDAMRGMLYKTAWAMDNNSKDTRMETALLKRYVPFTAMEVADSAMQVMGSIGYLSSTKAARIWEECRGNRMAEGTDQVMTVVASKRIIRRIESELENPPIWRF